MLCTTCQTSAQKHRIHIADVFVRCWSDLIAVARSHSTGLCPHRGANTDRSHDRIDGSTKTLEDLGL